MINISHKMPLLMAGWLTDYSVFGCQPVDYSDSANGVRMARACWLFFISKYVELSDTVFFILRKKNSQVTFLHVFHHGALPIFWWFGVKIVPGGFGTFHTMVNAFVHTVMYFYYGVSALGPRYRKYLWWKRYITILQLTQFFIVTLHNSQLLFVHCDNYPVIFAIAIQGFTSSVAILFLNFYIKTYISNRQHGKVEQNGLAQNGHITQNGEVHSKMKYN
ncbi:hypothetical protein CHS0354_021667 [Potamilus streckersoni]|uniref:Elongation of very long chain fatty acids protein n=1 Tax=Potamilus streckersoni TaxID=2493646 RepID=A0AAE0SPR1_9BIVA|nr:hypothetical protein CHS0354_021667 [Potamilus streckersoni]